jgi:hypothetical protein
MSKTMVGNMQMTARVLTVAGLLLCVLITLRAQEPDFTVYVNRNDMLAFHTRGCERLTSGFAPRQYSDIFKNTKLMGPCPVCGKDLSASVEVYRKWKADEPARREKEAEAARARENERARLEKIRLTAEVEKRAVAAAAETKRLDGPLPTLSEVSIRPAATRLAATADNDPNRFTVGFYAEIRKSAPDFGGPLDIRSGGSLTIMVAGPVAKYGFKVSEAVRRFLTTPASAAWDATYSVYITPTKIDALNIERVILQRNGATVAAIASTLKPSVKVTAMNAKAVINEGEVTFPVSAFAPAPGLALRLVAIPTSGDNIVHVFTNKELHSIR